MASSFPYEVDEFESHLISEEELKTKFPKTYNYLSSHRSRLEKRKQYSQWYGFSAPRSLVQHNSAQIIIPLLANRGLFAFLPTDKREQLCLMASGGFTITIGKSCPLDPKFVLGLLNSKLLFWNLQQASSIFRGG